MDQKTFISFLQKSCHLDSTQITMLLSSLCRLMAEQAVNLQAVAVDGLGTFTSHKHPEYIQEDEHTGAMVLYPPRITFRFSAAQPIDNQAAQAFCQLLSEYTHTDETVVNSFMHEFAQLINATITNGEEVEVKGLGTFRTIDTQQARRIAFVPDESMRAAVNAPFDCFEPYEIRSAVVRPSAPSIEMMPQEEEIEKDGSFEEDSTEEVLKESVVDEHEETVVEEPEESVVEEHKETIVEEPEEAIVEEAKREDVAAEEPSTEDVATEAPITEEAIQDIPVAESESVKTNKQEKSSAWLYAVVIVLLLAAIGLFVWIFRYSSVAVLKQDLPVMEVSADTLTSEIPVVEGEQHDSSTLKQDSVPTVPQDSETERPQDIAAEEVSPTVVAPIEEPDKPVVAPSTPISSSTATEDLSGKRLRDEHGNYVTFELQPGERLTIVALERYGDKAFWPYIYDVNTDRLTSPNVVPVGVRLYLPDPQAFHIDANDPNSLQRAKQRGAVLLKAK